MSDPRAAQFAETVAALRRAITAKVMPRSKDDTYTQGWNDALCIILDQLDSMLVFDGERDV